MAGYIFFGLNKAPISFHNIQYIDEIKNNEVSNKIRPQFLD
jgi:hypothetical protein